MLSGILYILTGLMIGTGIYTLLSLALSTDSFKGDDR